MTAPAGPFLDAGVEAVSRQFMKTANGLSTVFTLSDLEEQLYATLENMAEGTDETQELAGQLALIDQMMVDKVEGYVSVIRSLEAMADARKGEADRLRERAKTAEKHAAWLKQRLLVHMQETGRQRVETTRFSLTVRENPPSCVVVDAALVPSEYQKTKIEVSVDRRGILDNYRVTGEIPAGVSIERGSSLRIA